MGKLAFTHRGRSMLLPPAELLEPHIERTDNHWYWCGEFVEDPFDRCAYFDWAPPFEVNTRWMVPRLLWQYANPAVSPRRAMLENTCGLFTCINPAHWRQRRGAIRIPARIVLPDSVDAVPVSMNNVTVDPYWQAELLVVHVRRIDSINTMCGAGPKHHGMAKTTVITCDDCIGAWVRANQPFTEVK